jgi:hypothetical protein
MCLLVFVFPELWLFISRLPDSLTPVTLPLQGSREELVEQLATIMEDDIARSAWEEPC